MSVCCCEVKEGSGEGLPPLTAPAMRKSRVREIRLNDEHIRGLGVGITPHITSYIWPAACPAMKQVRSDFMCCIGRVLSLLFMVVLCEGVLLVLSDPVEHSSVSGWIPWFPRAENRFTLSHSLHRS